MASSSVSSSSGRGVDFEILQFLRAKRQGLVAPVPYCRPSGSQLGTPVATLAVRRVDYPQFPSLFERAHQAREQQHRKLFPSSSCASSSGSEGSSPNSEVRSPSQTFFGGGPNVGKVPPPRLPKVESLWLKEEEELKESVLTGTKG